MEGLQGSWGGIDCATLSVSYGRSLEESMDQELWGKSLTYSKINELWTKDEELTKL